MADVQIDKGEFTRIANVLLEQTAKARLNGTQYSIILTIWRYTYGFRRSEHDMSISYIAKATGISTRSIKKELKNLIEGNVIQVIRESTKSDSRVLKFNKDYDTWKVGNNSSPGEQSIPSEGNNQTPQQGNKKTPKKEIKENSKEIDIPYSEIIDYLNLIAKTSYRTSNKKTRSLIQARWKDGFVIDDFKTVIDKKCRSWLDNDMAKYLRPETLFGSKFESYLNEIIPTKYTDNPSRGGPVKAW